MFILITLLAFASVEGHSFEERLSILTFKCERVEKKLTSLELQDEVALEDFVPVKHDVDEVAKETLSFRVKTGSWEALTTDQVLAFNSLIGKLQVIVERLLNVSQKITIPKTHQPRAHAFSFYLLK